MKPNKIQAKMEKFMKELGPIKREVKSRVREFERNSNIKMPQEAKDKLVKKVIADYKRRALWIGITGAIGISGMFGAYKGGKYLGESNDKKHNIEFSKEFGRDQIGIEIDKNTVVKLEEKTEGKTEEKSFEESLKVDASQLEDISNFIDSKKKLEQNVKDDVSKLNTKEDVLTYIKQMYVEEYNNKNHTAYTAEDVTLSKKRFYDDFENGNAENGDDILVDKSSSSEPNEVGINTVFVGGNFAEKFAWDYASQSYKTIHDSENVESDTPTTDLAEVISLGIDYSSECSKPNNGESYKKFCDAIIKYKEGNINKIVENKELDRE